MCKEQPSGQYATGNHHTLIQTCMWKLSIELSSTCILKESVVDKCIQMLMKYERDKIFERVSKLEKGKKSALNNDNEKAYN